MSSKKLNGYTLTRAWFDWCMDNPEKIRPIHTAIYLYAVETSNRLGWVEKFGFPTRYVMQILGISDWRTYNKALNDLIEFGFLKLIKKSQNQYQSAIIAIVKNTEPIHYHNSITTLSNSESNQNHNNITTVINKPNKPINNKTNKREKQKTLAFDFLQNNCSEFMEYFKTEYGFKIKDKKSFVTKFNNKMVIEKTKLEPDVIIAQLENYAISWIENQERFTNKNEVSTRPRYF